MTLKSCWTCRGRRPIGLFPPSKKCCPLSDVTADRKVKCDLGTPTCSNCRHRNLQCQGYGLRLSWPRQGDKRRAVELKSIERQKKHLLAKLYQHSHFLNMTKWDMDLFYELSEAKSNSELLRSLIRSFACQCPLTNGCKSPLPKCPFRQSLPHYTL